MARRDRPVSQRQAWWLLAAALSAFLPLAPHLPLWLTLSSGAGLLLRGWITLRQWRQPPRWLLVIAVIAGTAAVGAEYRTLFGRVPGIAMLSIFLALKLLELRAARDALATVLLCYFLVLAQFMFAQTITNAVIALATVLITTATLAAAADDRPPPQVLLRRAGIMLAQALPFMLLLFVLFPRVQGPLWGLPQDRVVNRTGLSESMSPGSIAELSQSDAIAFRVKFQGPPPGQSQLYWRGPVLPHFDGKTWTTARKSGTLTTPPYAVTGPEVSYEITLEPSDTSWLFALEHPEALPPESSMTDEMQILSRSLVRNRLRYSLSSFPQTTLIVPQSAASLRGYLALPKDGNPRTRAIAAQWRERHGEDAASIVATAEDFFARQLLAYTLTPPLIEGDSVDGFLFETKRGFCEHFSSAFVFALRAAGVPARVVTGYQGGELNSVDGYLVVRQYDAHAWTEVWLGERGWVRVDPTAISAPRRIADNFAASLPAGEALPLLARPDLAWLRAMRNRLDAIANGWNQWVLAYNPDRQRELLQSLGMKTPDWQNMTAVLALLCGSVLLLLTAWILYQRQRLDPARRAWLNFTRRLARRGVVWQEWEGPQDFARRAAAALPTQAESIHAIAAAYARQRYAATAGGPGTTDGINQLTDLVRRFHP
jgi:transglutaminase-like putative cysteine protease